ncbi:copper amine oxidase N-terminal domain-containing protein [Paenibacillus contaminans]|uniref:Copper amine oxidase-like N-terminal domain-containing protein n=1 Tax=Paenibacillus contaminans TaxID=450362 RepID=A0A329LSL5_9BACL|nr:copper amine oxidase N-terminal domain-containing protein [Paenibacillus contaminans]RAV10132.1 hypothetical protein DQG23_38455 [Paenibacillus contaminans]
MFIRTFVRKTGALFLAALIVLSGCQAIGGLDLNKALSETFVPKAMEGSVSLVLDLDIDESQAAPEQLPILKLLDNVEFRFDTLKVESAERMSAAGALVVAKRNIPFTLFGDKDKVVFQVDGAKKPIVIDSATLNGQADAVEMNTNGFVAEMLKKLSAPDLSRSIVSYLIKQLPNPSKVSVTNVSEPVHGETVSMFKLHGEVDGTQLLPLAKQFLLNMMKDDQALKELIGQVYDALQPIVAAELEKATVVPGMGAVDTQNADYTDGIGGAFGDLLEPGTGVLAPLMNGLQSIWNDRETAIEVIHTEVKQVLVIATVGLASIGTEGQDTLSEVFGDTTVAAADLYFDHDLQLRKANAALTIMPKMASNDGVSAVHLTIASEFWSINGAVKADPIDTSAGSLSLTTDTKMIDVLLNLERNSAAFKLLKDDLQVTRKQIYLSMANGEYEAGTTQPFIADDVAMAPTRFLTEKLDAQVEWNDRTRTITVTDPLTGTTILISPDSRMAKVNGVDVNMGHETMIVNDTSFVPLRFIVTTLGGKIEWVDQDRMIIIIKE